MAGKERLPNKVQWGLLDIVSLAGDARTKWDRAMKLAEKNMDAEMVIELARLGTELADIQRKAKDAINCQYEEK